MIWSCIASCVENNASTARQTHECLSKKVALAVFSSDAISSVAYATEEILHVLVLGGLRGTQLVASDSQTSLLSKGALLFRRNKVVTSVPYRLDS